MGALCTAWVAPGAAYQGRFIRPTSTKREPVSPCGPGQRPEFRVPGHRASACAGPSHQQKALSAHLRAHHPTRLTTLDAATVVGLKLARHVDGRLDVAVS